MTRKGSSARRTAVRARHGRAVRLRRVATACAVVAAVSACRDPAVTPVAAGHLTEIEADQVIYGMTTFITQEGVRSAEVHADTSYAFNDSSVAYLKGVDMKAFSELGLEKARVVADSGRLHHGTEKMVAWGNVVVTLPEGDRRIETSELHYDPAADRIWSDSATVLTQAGRVTRGSGFRSDLRFENWSITNPVGAASVRPPGQGGAPEGGGGAER